jgi:DNA-binding CsgD family transcriptional regulator
MHRSGDDTTTRMARRIADLLALSDVTVDEMLDGASRAICDELADACVIGILFDEGRKIHPLGAYHRDADRRRRLESLSELPWEATDGVIGRILDAAQPEVLSRAELELASSRRPWAAALLAGAGIDAAVAVPMRALGSQIGLLAAGRETPRPLFDTADVAAVQDVADRLGLAVLALHLDEEVERLTMRDHDADPTDAGIAALTTRERQILVLIARGLSSREIGEQLFLSVRTVEWHRARLMVKVGATKRSELIAIGWLLASGRDGPNLPASRGPEATTGDTSPGDC